MSTFYVRKDGTATSLGAATSDSSASTSINISRHNSLKGGINPGDVVVVSDAGGVFLGDQLDADGVSGVVYRANDGGSPKITNQDQALSMERAENVTWDGIDIEAGGYAAARAINPGSNCTIRNSRFSGAMDYGFCIGDYDGNTPFSGWVFEDCTFTGNGVAGLNINFLGSFITIRRNQVFLNCTNNGNWGGGIKLYGDVAHLEGCEIHDNVVYDNGPLNKNGNQGDGVGIWLDAVLGTEENPILVHDNLVYGNNGNGIFVEISDHCHVYNNTCVDNGFNSNGDDEFTPANITVDARGEGSTRYFSRYNRVYNNSCYGGRCGYKCASYSQVGTTKHLVGNIFEDNISFGAEDHELLCAGGGDNDSNGSGNSYINNCFGPERIQFIQWGYGEYFSDYASWLQAAGEQWSYIEGDPLYADPLNNNLSLLDGSPCKGEGWEIGSGGGGVIPPPDPDPDPEPEPDPDPVPENIIINGEEVKKIVIFLRR